MSTTNSTASTPNVGALQPVPATIRPSASDHYGLLYTRSFLIMRLTIGVLGLLLPALLILGSEWVTDPESFPRGSLSAYYHSGARDLFVGTLCAIGMFLVGYKVMERNLDNTLSLIAGFAAIGVALFPTDVEPDILRTLFQLRIGEGVSRLVHYSSAAIFLGCLAGLSYLFGKREGARPARPGHRSPKFWQTFHWVLAATIVFGVALCLISLIVGEIVAVVAFSFSWLFKGLELEMLRGQPTTVSLDEAVQQTALAS
jgi:hypothetical protein